MSSTFNTFLTGFALLFPGGLIADQNDARLDELFLTIQQSESAAIARGAEDQIWNIWHQHDDPSVQARLAEGIRAMNDDPRRALHIFNALIEQHPDFAEGWNKRATLFYALGEYTASERDIERTLKLEPRHFGALSGLGLVLLATGDLVAARSTFEATLLIHPHARGARQNIKRITEHLRRETI